MRRQTRGEGTPQPHVTIELGRSRKTGRALARIYSDDGVVSMQDVTEHDLLKRIARMSEQGKLRGAK